MEYKIKEFYIKMGFKELLTLTEMWDKKIILV
jgi:hypothetical protein